MFSLTNSSFIHINIRYESCITGGISGNFCCSHSYVINYILLSSFQILRDFKWERIVAKSSKWSTVFSPPICSFRSISFFRIRPQRSLCLLEILSLFNCSVIIFLIRCFIKVLWSASGPPRFSKCSALRSFRISRSLSFPCRKEQIRIMSQIIVNQQISILIWHVVISSPHCILVAVLRLIPSIVVQICFSARTFIGSVWVVISLKIGLSWLENWVRLLAVAQKPFVPGNCWNHYEIYFQL